MEAMEIVGAWIIPCRRVRRRFEAEFNCDGAETQKSMVAKRIVYMDERSPFSALPKRIVISVPQLSRDHAAAWDHHDYSLNKIQDEMSLVRENMAIPFQTLEAITKDFAEEQKIGCGGYGHVYKGVYNGEEIAVKKLRPLHGIDDRAFDNEFHNLCKIHHLNVIRLIGYCYDPQYKFINHNGELVRAKKVDRVLCFEYEEGGGNDKHISEIVTGTARYSKRSEMSPQQFTEIVYENWRNRWKLQLSSKQRKRLNKIVLSCLQTGKSTKATRSIISSTQRAAHDILVLDSGVVISTTVDVAETKPLPACITAPNMDSVDLVLDSDGSALAAAPSMQQHLSRSNLADERSDKPRSNRAPATNSSDETTRAPMANKLTEDGAENHSDPNSCMAERDTIEEAKRSGEWFVATGAANHATGDLNQMTDLERLENDDLYVHGADGTPMPVRGRGKVVTDTVVLPDVYYVPGLWTNLVSVGQLAGLDYCVGFGRGACVVSDAAGTVVGRAHARGDGLYEVDFLRVSLAMT